MSDEVHDPAPPSSIIDEREEKEVKEVEEVEEVVQQQQAQEQAQEQEVTGKMQPNAVTTAAPPQSLHECLGRLVQLTLEQLARQPKMVSPELCRAFATLVRERVPSIGSLMSIPLVRQLEKTHLLPSKLDAEQQQIRATTHFLWVGQHDEIEPTDVIDMHAVPDAVQDLVQLACNVLHEEAASHNTTDSVAFAGWNVVESDIRSLYHECPTLQTAACGFLWTFLHAHLLANLVVFGHQHNVPNAEVTELIQSAWRDTFWVLCLWLNQLKQHLAGRDDLIAFGLDKYTPKSSLMNARDVLPGISDGLLKVARVLRLTRRKAPSRWSQQVMERAQAKKQQQQQQQQRATAVPTNKRGGSVQKQQQQQQPEEEDDSEEEDEEDEDQEEEDEDVDEDEADQVIPVKKQPVVELKKQPQQQQQQQQQRPKVIHDEDEAEDMREVEKHTLLPVTRTVPASASHAVIPSTNTFDHTTALNRFSNGPRSLFGRDTTPAPAPIAQVRKVQATVTTAHPSSHNLPRRPGAKNLPRFKFTGDDDDRQ
jgi:hypothetical protein